VVLRYVCSGCGVREEEGREGEDKVRWLSLFSHTLTFAPSHTPHPHTDELPHVSAAAKVNVQYLVAELDGMRKFVTEVFEDIDVSDISDQYKTHMSAFCVKANAELNGACVCCVRRIFDVMM